MEQVTLFISYAHTKEYGLEIVNLVYIASFTIYKVLHHAQKPIIDKKPALKTKKWRYEDDISSENKENASTLTTKYQKLAAHTACESCKENCHITRSSMHQHLDYKKLSYWAKQNICYLQIVFKLYKCLFSPGSWCIWYLQSSWCHLLWSTFKMSLPSYTLRIK